MFNTTWPGEDDLGNILFDNYADFASRVKYLDDETQQAYTDKLQQEGVIDIELTEEAAESNLGVQQTRTN